MYKLYDDCSLCVTFLCWNVDTSVSTCGNEFIQLWSWQTGGLSSSTCEQNPVKLDSLFGLKSPIFLVDLSTKFCLVSDCSVWMESPMFAKKQVVQNMTPVLQIIHTPMFSVGRPKIWLPSNKKIHLSQILLIIVLVLIQNILRRGRSPLKLRLRLLLQYYQR